MARIGAFLFLAVGILSTSANGYGLPGKQLVSKIIDKASSIVGKQKQTDVSLELPENAYPVENVPISFTCHGGGLYTYPDDCTLGVLCRRGLYTLFTCTDVLHFNNVTKECDSFCSARCDPMLACVCGWDSCHASKETSVTEESETEEVTNNKLKAPINCITDGYFPDPVDCNKFYQCSNGDLFFKRCFSGLHFNKETGRCERPCDAGCDPTLSCNVNSDDTSTEMAPTEDNESDDQDEDKPRIPFTCPRDGLFASREHCNQYFDCWHGQLAFRTCPPGLHFNKKEKRCDRPCKAKCDPNITCRQEIRQTSETPDASEVTPSDSSKSPKKVFKLKLKFVCFDDGLFPDPKDCSKYINCSSGVSYELSCPPGKHFNNQTERCESPCSAKCDPNLMCKWRQFKNKFQENIIKESPKELCSKAGVYLERNPLDCETYFRCEDGDANLLQCPDGQHFSQETLQCEEPCNAHCDVSMESIIKESPKELCLKTGVYLERNPYDCETYFKCEDGDAHLLQCSNGQHFNKETLQCGESCNARCDLSVVEKCGWEHENVLSNSLKQPISEFQCRENGIYSHIDCENFIQCTDGQAYLMNCPNGEHFDVWLKSCTTPCLARCAPNYEEFCEEEATILSSSLKQPIPEFQCRENGIYAHAACENFIQCTSGQAYLMNCPNGEHFDPWLKSCTTPCLARCAPNYEDFCEEEATILSNSLKQPISEFQCRENGIYSNIDCENFIQCTDGQAYLMNCPNGEHFDVWLKSCTTPCLARCAPNYEDFCEEEAKILSNSLKQPISEFQCRENGIYSHIDCEKFIQCTDGQAYLMNCPNGEHFDVWLKSCTTPCLARCAPNYEDFCEEEAKLLSNSLKQPISEFQCRENGMYSHIDCEKFIQCTDGQAYLMNCPNGEHFDVWLKSCTTPCLARCAPNYEDFCEEEAKNRSPKQLLKDFDCVTDGYHADPLDCGSFIQCFRGEAYAISCPADLHYSHTLEICMSPCEAKCAPNYEEYCRAEERDKRRKLQRPRNNSVKQPFPLVTKFTCGVHPSDDGVYANPENCNSYIQCIVGESFIKLCPLGLHFSEKTKTCESPCEAQCDSSIGAYCGWDEYWTPTETTEESTFDYEMFLAASPRSLMYHFTCMKDGVYRNPDDCSTFIQCSGGHSYLMACPPGLHFSEELKKCYYKCAAWCDVTLACECGWVSCFDYQKTSQEVDCEAEPDEGHCNGRIPRYAYDVSSGRCRGFHYGGCGGNSNNFKTMEECENKCQKKLLGGFRCPEDSGMFGHFPDCMSYYHCKRGVPTLKRCPKGTAFDHKRSKCVTEYEATCVYECRHKDAVYPYEEDCHKYIDCVNGISKLEKCPAGKAFDPNEKDCVDEKQVESCFWASESKH